MKKSLIALAAAAALAFLPFTAQAATVGATTSQTTTQSYGHVNSYEVSNQNTNGVQFQVAVSGSYVTPQTCVNSCTGTAGNINGSLTITKFNSSDTKTTYYNGTQSQYDITCAVSAYSNPF